MEKLKKLIITLWNSEVIRYLVIGGLTTVISIASFAGFLFLLEPLMPQANALAVQLANVLSWILAVTFAYLANKFFVFQTKDIRGKALLREIELFVGARVFSLGVEAAGLWLFVTVLGMNELIAKVILQFVVIVLNYIFSKLVIFKKKGETKA